AVDEERSALEVAHTDEVWAVLDEPHKILAFFCSPLPLGDVAHDLRRAHHSARRIFDGRYRQRYHDVSTVCPHPHGFEMFDPLAGLQARDDAVFLLDALWRNHQRDVTADRLLGGVAEHPLGGRVPGLNDALE